ncbi:hypothetical protein XENOCAPTIV_028341, partial [Xenoophorus captivus]
MQRGRSSEACSCFSGVCHLHQRRLSSELMKFMIAALLPLFYMRCESNFFVIFGSHEKEKKQSD